MILTIVSFVVVLGVLIFFHELGHFLAARLLGVGVETFSLGFGPKLVGWKSGITQYQVAAFPLGGYVKMVGEDPDEEEDKEPVDETISFSHKPLRYKAMIVAAGPIFNLVLAVLLYLIVYAFVGVELTTTTVGEVLEDSPAIMAGVKAGDEFVSINGQKIEKWEDVRELVEDTKGAPMNLVVRRNGEELTITLSAEKAEGKNVLGEDVEYYRIGAASKLATSRNPVNVVVRAFEQSWFWCEITVRVVYKIITGSISAKNLGGAIAIAQMSGKAAQAGFFQFLAFMAVLSINLGIINFFPIPILDGGHLVFFAIEGILRRPLGEKAREIAMQVGLVMLLLLMILVFYNDITRVIAQRAVESGG